jgi:histone H2A
MADKGKGGRGKGYAGAKAVGESTKAGIKFPVGWIARFMKKRNFTELGTVVPMYLPGCFEYLADEVVELADNDARDNNKKTKIVKSHIMLAVRDDEELKKFLN